MKALLVAAVAAFTLVGAQAIAQTTATPPMKSEDNATTAPKSPSVGMPSATSGSVN